MRRLAGAGDHQWQPLSFLAGRNAEAKRRSGSGFGLHPDGAPESFHDLFAGGQANTGPGNRLGVEAREDAEYELMLLLGDAYAIVADSDDPVWSERLLFG